MTTAVVLIFIWTLTFLLMPTLQGALVIAVLATGCLLGLGRQLSPKGAATALAAILLGLLINNQGLTPYALPVVAGSLLFGVLWFLVHRTGPPPRRI